MSHRDEGTRSIEDPVAKRIDAQQDAAIALQNAVRRFQEHGVALVNATTHRQRVDAAQGFVLLHADVERNIAAFKDTLTYTQEAHGPD